MPGYVDNGYLVVPGLVDPHLCAFLVDYCLVRLDADGFDDDGQVVGSKTTYGDPAFDTLLARLAPSLSSHAGLALTPTYSFVRLYLEGQALAPHRDRPSCEHSVTLHLGSSGDNWPLMIRPASGAAVSIGLEQGDALLYRGTDHIHWRDPLPGAWYLQAFLHYVDGRGAFAEHALDGRTGLGRPRGV